MVEPHHFLRSGRWWWLTQRFMLATQRQVLGGATIHLGFQGLGAKWPFFAMSASPAVRGAQDTVTTLLLLRRDGASLMPAAAAHHQLSFAPSRSHWPATIFRLHGHGRRCYTSETIFFFFASVTISAFLLFSTALPAP